MMAPQRYRLPLYALLNVAFISGMGIAYAVGDDPNPRFLHLTLLFALCSSFIIDFDGFNGRYALLGMFMLIYFVSFGIGDFTALLVSGAGQSSPLQRSTPALTSAEVVILAGGIVLVLGYRLAVLIVGSRPRTAPPRDWSKKAILFLGLLFWIVGTLAAYRWYFYIVKDTTNESARKGLASISPWVTILYLLGQMCQPLGMILLAYAYRVSRGPYLWPLVICVVLVQLIIGFIVDVKGLAMLGIMVVIVTSVLVDGRLPKFWLAGFLLFVIFLFPIFQAYRGVIHGNITRSAALENFSEVLKKTIAAKDKVNNGRDRAQTFLERGSVKSSVEVIVQNAGNGVPFQHGYTLAPVLATFVPKILWSDKPSVPTGQLFNKQFHITDNDDVFISPSHLGELYWNFGWPGVLVGMTLIGFTCGWVGGRFNLADSTSITRVLVTVITIKQLVVGFEGGIADIYVVWLRSLAGIGLLHWMFARVPVDRRSQHLVIHSAEAGSQPVVGKPFSNLLA